MTTSLPVSRALDALARKVTKPCANCEGDGHMSGPIVHGVCTTCHGSGVVHPYAETGMGGWLAEKGIPFGKVWVEHPDKAELYVFAPPAGKYYHAPDLLTALTFMEETQGWKWEREWVNNGVLWTAFTKGAEVTANTPEELLAKIMEATG